ncbi:MAG: hypothetical protein NUV98_04140 [Candidatus Roizmanbacteria bacterium]|nr:hypothetical protein [Candidatus Roizmanbacteria bacterium]
MRWYVLQGTVKRLKMYKFWVSQSTNLTVVKKWTIGNPVIVRILSYAISFRRPELNS